MFEVREETALMELGMHSKILIHHTLTLQFHSSDSQTPRMSLTPLSLSLSSEVPLILSSNGLLHPQNWELEFLYSYILSHTSILGSDSGLVAPSTQAVQLH